MWIAGIDSRASANEVEAQSAKPATAGAARATAHAPVPNTILMRGERLVEARRLFAMNEPALKPTFDVIMASANAALKAPLQNVMQKGRVPSSGNKHDYMSMAPYFWPNPNTKDSLPYVNRDAR